VYIVFKVSKIKRTFFTVALISFLLILLVVQTVNAYDNNEYGFSITPPSMWSLIEDTDIQAVVGFEKTDSTASISVAVVESSHTLSEIVEGVKGSIEGIKDYLSRYLTDFSLVYETWRSIGGLDCYEFEYTMTHGGFSAKIRQVIFVENGKEFVITYQASESEYVDYLPDAENSIASFRVLADSSDDSSDGAIDNTLLIIGLISAVIILAVVLGLFLLMKRHKPVSPVESVNSTQDFPQ